MTRAPTTLSAWVIVAMEESKGLGKYFFEPDGLLTATASTAMPIPARKARP